MAVVIQCFHCNTILELDEGFRGGVCRCSTCGSLLQVPQATETDAPKIRPAAPGEEPTQPSRPASPIAESDAKQKPDPESDSSGQRPATPDTGGSSSGLRSGKAARPAAPPAPVTPAVKHIEKVAPPNDSPSSTTPATSSSKEVKKKNVLLIGSIVMVGIVVVAVLIAAIWLVARASSASKQAIERVVSVSSSNENKTTDGKKPTVVEPKRQASSGSESIVPSVTPTAMQASTDLLGIPLVGKKILVSIDGASSMTDHFDYVRAAVYGAVERLGSGQALEVVVWRGEKVTPYPQKGFIDKVGLESLKEEFDAISARGSSDVTACMKASLALGADQVIFITAKPALDPAIAQDILADKGPAARLDSIKIDSEDSPSPLEELSQKSGGLYRFITGAKLQDMIH
ncbi:MAG: hypothetical protein FWD61_12705 [Phycisphaerales bacterium]|nr:hypothetical protein [Phycisphaerales bacterium]